MRSFGPLTVALLLAYSAFACGGSVVVGAGGAGATAGATSTSAATSAASTSNSTGGTGGGAVVACGGTESSSFPSFDKACATTSQCVVEFHQVDCCGTRVAIGMLATEKAAFAAAEATCEAMYPGCGCAEEPTKAEDGKSTTDEATISVACTMGACTSFVM